MSITILEALENAEINFNGIPFQQEIAKSQLHNAIVLFDKGYDAEDNIDELLEKYGKVEEVPDKEE